MRLRKRIFIMTLTILFAFSSVPTAYAESDPDSIAIESIIAEKADADSVLNFLAFGIFGNGSVEITVEAIGTKEEQDTTIYLGEEGNYDSAIASAELRDDGKYHYIAVFSYNVPMSANLSAYAVNDSGESDKFGGISGISDSGDSINAIEAMPFVLESTVPVVSVGEITSDYQQVESEITILDADSGIAKVEYGWDIDENLCDDEKNALTGNYLGFSENNYTDEYVEYVFDNTYKVEELSFTLELSHEDSVWTRDNQHTLYLRVTDNAGNIYEEYQQDPVGSDMDAPNISNVEIGKAQTNTSDSVLRFLSFGTFSNDAVDIVVEADDNESQEGVYASGIDTVKVNEREMQINEEGNYLLTVSGNDSIGEMCITAKDNAGWSTSASVTEILGEEGSIESNDLMVENSAPAISFEFSRSGSVDDSEKTWYGAGSEESPVTLEITSSDNRGSLESGLYSIKIVDDEETIFSKEDFSSLVSEHKETFHMTELENGIHTLSVTVEDNAGNITTDSVTFYVDCTLPESQGISVVSSPYLTVAGKKWFDIDDVITFRVDFSDADSGLHSALISINGTEFKFSSDDFRSDEDGTYVLVDTTDINADSEHKYVVSGTVTDLANNVLTLEDITVYKDLDNPTISKFTVEKKNKALDKILNVLTFGAYSNDTLIFKVHASDGRYDIGVDYVTVLYDGLSAPVNMTNEGNDIFSVEIQGGMDVFQSDFAVVVYDKYGRSSNGSPDLEDAESGSMSQGKFAMIDTIKPVLSLSMPMSEGLNEADSRIWYNSNKEMVLEIRDEDSGIRNIGFWVNDVEITYDKEGTALLRTTETEAAFVRNTNEQSYIFDTEFFTRISGEPEDGKYAIRIEVSDNAGNVTIYENSYFMDDIVPVIDRIDFAPQTSNAIKDTSEFIERFEYGFFFKSEVTITVNVSDESPSSGLHEVRYRFVHYQNGVKQSEDTGSKEIVDGQVQITVPRGLKGQIFLEAFDNVGNRSGEKGTKAFVVDNTSPEIHITENVSTSYYDRDGNNLYDGNNSITVVITDRTCGIKEIGYSQSAEMKTYDRKNIVLDKDNYSVGEDLGEGWKVSSMDANLVTEVTKTFLFDSDDNDIILTFDAMDNAFNIINSVQSKKFTIDKTNPLIYIVFREDEDEDAYYSQNRVADITVIERNFDENLIRVLIENSFGNTPSFSFSQKSITEHTATIDFDEGDYRFDVTGTDLGNRTAAVTYSGGNEKLFYVDKTNPVIIENFIEFEKNNSSFAEKNNSFNSDKTVNIEITEHNFDSTLTNLRITRKEAGEVHTGSGLVDVTSEVLGGARWVDSGDVHTITFTISHDAVYQVEIEPTDLAGNTAENRNTVVFEIDKTVPIVKAKNGIWVPESDVEFLDVYPYSRRDEPAPTVEFEDINIDHIRYDLTVYIPDHTSSEALTTIRPAKVYLDEDRERSGRIEGKFFTLPDFVKDGVYALELTAVDVAGNESLVNFNTYARMVEQDVLAYILESNPTAKTGLYSFQYENGEAISKRPDNFSDIKIFVLARKDTDIDIVLRDNNAVEVYTNAQATVDDSIYGVGIYNYVLEADFFKENFQDDIDIELHLSVKNEGNRIDLGTMHIDNIAPACDLPQEFNSWHWYYGEEERVITISNISELVDVNKCKIIDNGNEVAFLYSSNEDTIVFTLDKGWHNVGIILEDMAGNLNNIQERTNIHIGFFWTWIIMASSLSTTAIVSFAVMRYIVIKRRLENE